MSETHDLREDRERKLELLREKGIDPYPSYAHRTHTIEAFLGAFDSLQGSGEPCTIVGRIMALREHGAIAFADLYDGSGKVQAFFSKENMDDAVYDLFLETMSTADFLEVTGTAYVTNRGVHAIAVTQWRVLAKALANIPTEHFGIKDPDEKLRKRYLDILIDSEVRDMFRKKALYWKASRRFLEDRGFEEVHTPTLEVTTGGAEAQPFATHHGDFDMDVFLRISVGELWQKKLMAAGLERVFEVGRVYRNEGSSPDHLQEFTNIEFYAAYVNFDEGLQMLEDHIRYVLDEVFEGQRKFSMKGYEVDFTNALEKIDYTETIKNMTGVDVLQDSDEVLVEKVRELGIEHEGTNRERMTDTLWKYCRKQIAGPVWLVGHPKLVSPLSKESQEKPGTVIRAQLIMAGAEFDNCFAELNDPQEQRERFQVQERLLKEGDGEAMMPDWEFVEALEHGIPPTFGAATLGERFFAYLVDRPIRETQYFPLMKPKE